MSRRVSVSNIIERFELIFPLSNQPRTFIYDDTTPSRAESLAADYNNENLTIF